MKDYPEFFTNVVANHLHKLVEMVNTCRREKVLLHEWILGIEYNWPEYIHVSDDESEFIPRLSFWIGGLRDRFNSEPKKSEVIGMLNKTFDASTFCFFEYGARDDILRQIEKYAKDVDDYFYEDILNHKLKKFKFSQKIVGIVNKAFDKLIESGVKQKEIDNIKISRNIDTASDLEKEFNKLIEVITKLFINSTNLSKRGEVLEYIKTFLKDCEKLGYEKTALYVKIVNLFRAPIKELEVTIRSKNISIKKPTDAKGEVIFLDVPRDNMILLFNYKKSREYKIRLTNSFYKKDVWLFSL